MFCPGVFVFKNGSRAWSTRRWSILGIDCCGIGLCVINEFSVQFWSVAGNAGMKMLKITDGYWCKWHLSNFHSLWRKLTWTENIWSTLVLVDCRGCYGRKDKIQPQDGAHVGTLFYWSRLYMYRTVFAPASVFPILFSYCTNTIGRLK